MPGLAQGDIELDTFDFIEDLRIKGFPKAIDVLTATSVDDTGYVYLPGGNRFRPDKNWCGRLVRCELDFTRQHIRFYALRRRDPGRHPLLCELPYPRPTKPFKGLP